MRRLVFSLVMLAFTLTLAPWQGWAAQQQPESQQGQMPRRGRMQGERVFGTVVSVGANQFQIKKSDGTTQTIQVNDQTRYRERRQPIQLEDLKPNDHVFVLGKNGENNQFEATMVSRMTQEQMERFGNRGGRAFGEIVSIENNQLKIKNRSGEEQTIAITGQTQFMKQGQPITLKDLKVGDRIFAIGKEADGQFVADRVMSGPMRRRGNSGGFGAPPPSQPPQPQ